jgi:AraC-like DNA-binding protein
MEVKNIFVNLIMRTYEKQGPMRAAHMNNEKFDNEMISDDVSISSKSSKRLFSDLMEHSLKKGLSEVRLDEN